MVRLVTMAVASLASVATHAFVGLPGSPPGQAVCSNTWPPLGLRRCPSPSLSTHAPATVLWARGGGSGRHTSAGPAPAPAAAAAAGIGHALKDLRLHFGQGLLAAAVLASPLSLSLQLQPPSQTAPYHPGSGGRVSLERPAAWALTEEQTLVVDVWREVNRQFVDGDFNGLGPDGWKQKKLDAVKGLAAKEGQTEEAYKAIRTMLAALDDPYTRFLTPDQYDALASVARGGSAGIGVQLAVDPTGDRGVLVLNTVQGGPAATGGVQPGDEVLSVDGEAMGGATAELVAAKMRGAVGSGVDVEVRHWGAAAGVKDPKRKAPTERLSLTRAAVKVSPVEARVVSVPTAATSSSSSSSSSSTSAAASRPVLVVKVSSFSQETVAQLVEALRVPSSSSLSVAAVAVDLRGNAGGYMPAGVDAAKLFLPPNAKIISEVRRDGSAEVFLSDGVGAETKVPLYLLVDARTASASEIMAAALQDNHRATLVGPSKTFGKGRIQNVQQLEDGSGVAVTKAKYVTPSGRDIHGVGLAPDVLRPEPGSCGPNDPAEACLSGLIP